ncbi:MAG: thiamine-phosphate kinase [Proteobacteria bacterium]|nr:thiamine-phosphate kinase [Pseudomonadota bacterium]MBU1056845.1 thiamine-phosphate kinase [Pseudomonadota bacterium]
MAAWSERELIRKILQAGNGQSTGLIKGIGDDCCEVVAHGAWLISTDTLVDSIHFDRSWHPPYLLGRKSVAVNLSDIAAMGGRPRFILLSLCLPKELDAEWISLWLQGALEILREYDCLLIGGDTVLGRELVLTVTVLGEPVGHGAIYRSGAGQGDTVWVSGPLGSAGAGLELFSAEKEKPGLLDLSRWQRLLDAHLNPLPCIGLGMELAESGLVSAMQDISDGIATDLAHICQASGVGGLIQAERLPFLPELTSAAEVLHLKVEDLILRSGEDYQLLFTVRRGYEEKLAQLLEEKGREVFKIGEIRAGQGLFLQTESKEKEISFQGYEH